MASSFNQNQHDDFFFANNPNVVRTVETRVVQDGQTALSGVPLGNTIQQVLNTQGQGQGQTISFSNQGNYGQNVRTDQYGNAILTGNNQYTTGNNGLLTGNNVQTITTSQQGGNEAYFSGITGVQTGNGNQFGQNAYVTRTSTTTTQPQVVVQKVETRTIQEPVSVLKTTTITQQPAYQIQTNYGQNQPLIEQPKYAQAEYNFYDGDVEDVHTEVPQSEGSATCGLIAGLLGLLAALTLVGLAAVLFSRTGTGCYSAIPLSHLIMCCIAVVAAALGLWVCFSSKKAIANHLDLNHLLIGIALILALIFFAYFLASGVYMYMYRPFNYADMTTQKCGAGTQWASTMGANKSFNDGWGQNRVIIFWIAFFCIIAAIGFLILAICLWLLSKFPVQLARLVLGCACLAGVILACFGITYLIQARNLYSNNYSMKGFKFSYLTTLLILFAIGIGLLFFNAVWNIFKKRSGHFIFGALLIIFVFIFVCFLGLMLRNFREQQFNSLQNASDGSCRDLLANFNQSCVNDYCPNKYLAAGASCSKEFLTNSWETDGSVRYINPCCCNNFSSAMLCPLYYAAIFGLLFVMAVIVAIAANFYLSDTSEYLEFSDKSFGIWELLFVIGIILCLIGFGVFWGLKASSIGGTCAQNPNDPRINRDQIGNVVSYTDPNFVPVNLNKVYNGTVPASAYLQGALRNTDASSPLTLAQQAIPLKAGNNIVTLNGNNNACGSNGNCGWRVGVLAQNARISSTFSGNVAGTTTARQLFFNDVNSNNDFVLLKGTQAEVNQALGQLTINPIDITQPSSVLVNGNQIDLALLNANGLQVSENPAPFTLTPNGNSFNGFAGYQTVDPGSQAACMVNNSCQSTLSCGTPTSTTAQSCNGNFVFYSSNGFIEVQAPVYVNDLNGNLVPYNGNSLASNSYFVHQNTQYALLTPQVNNGVFSFAVPKPLNGNINAVLSLTDSANQYIPYSRYIVIPADAPSPYVINNINLLTKSGKGCQGSSDVNACFANQKVLFSKVVVNLTDSETGKTIPNAPVKLMSGIDGGRALVSNNTDANGIAVFNNVAYDYYTIQYDGSANYLPTRAQIAAQSVNTPTFNLGVHQRTSGNTILQQYVTNANVDQDFNLNIVSLEGKSCNVTPYTKYCGYASHVNDVENNSQGFENIRIHNFTVSNYLGYLQNNPASAATCGASDISGLGYYPTGEINARSLSFNWENVRKTQAVKPTYQSLYCFNGWGLNTLRYLTSASNTPLSANVCSQFWPAGSQFALDKLNKLNKA